MDNELFELCKEVYEATGWNDEKAPLVQFNPHPESVAPDYTSDYLLEKLKDNKYPELSRLFQLEGDDIWLAYADEGRFTEHADTPLKALLKLTLALHEAGELK